MGTVHWWEITIDTADISRLCRSWYDSYRTCSYPPQLQRRRILQPHLWECRSVLQHPIRSRWSKTAYWIVPEASVHGVWEKRSGLWEWRDFSYLPKSNLPWSVEFTHFFPRRIRNLRKQWRTSIGTERFVQWPRSSTVWYCFSVSKTWRHKEVQYLHCRANKPYMPFERDSDMDCRRNYSRENPINCFLAGDIRANEQVRGIWRNLSHQLSRSLLQLGLMSMHTIFLREHNRIASKLLDVNENWDGETIFQETRKIIGAMLQHVTYNDWLPKILGRATYDTIIGEYKGYNPDINPTIANEFATAALRFAHTLINPHLFRFDKDFKEIKEGHIPLHNVSQKRLLWSFTV